MSLLQRARDSGKCPPSLLAEERVAAEDGFDEAVLKVLDDSGKKICGLRVFLSSGFVYRASLANTFLFLLLDSSLCTSIGLASCSRL